MWNWLSYLNLYFFNKFFITKLTLLRQLIVDEFKKKPTTNGNVTEIFNIRLAEERADNDAPSTPDVKESKYKGLTNFMSRSSKTKPKPTEGSNDKA